MEKDTANIETVSQGEDNPAFEVDESVSSKDDSKDASDISKNYGTQVEKGLEEEPERQQWSNPIEFLLSCIAMSVRLSTFIK